VASLFEIGYFRLKPDTSNSHEFELHRPSNKGTKLLLKVIKAIIIIKGAEARNNARVGTLAKHEWVLVHAIEEGTTAIPPSVTTNIK